MVKGRKVYASRGVRRTFAKKAGPTMATLRHTFIERGGGYL